MFSTHIWLRMRSLISCSSVSTAMSSYRLEIIWRPVKESSSPRSGIASSVCTAHRSEYLSNRPSSTAAEEGPLAPGALASARGDFCHTKPPRLIVSSVSSVPSSAWLSSGSSNFPIIGTALIGTAPLASATYWNRLRMYSYSEGDSAT